MRKVHSLFKLRNLLYLHEPSDEIDIQLSLNIHALGKEQEVWRKRFPVLIRRCGRRESFGLLQLEFDVLQLQLLPNTECLILAELFDWWTHVLGQICNQGRTLTYVLSLNFFYAVILVGKISLQQGIHWGVACSLFRELWLQDLVVALVVEIFE